MSFVSRFHLLAESAFRYLLIISGPHAQVRTVLEFPITRNKGRSLYQRG